MRPTTRALVLLALALTLVELRGGADLREGFTTAGRRTTEPSVSLAAPRRMQASSSSRSHVARQVVRGDAALSLVPVGAAGSGKSETCNTIFGKSSRFVVNDGMETVTTETESEPFTFEGASYRIFDTPGYLETDAMSKLDDLVLPVARGCERGIDVFLLTFSCGRWGLEQNATYKLFKETFGPEAVKHAVVVFTKCGTKTAASFIKDMRQVVPDVLEELGVAGPEKMPPVVAMGELTPEGRAKDRRRLLEVAESLHDRNGGRPYDGNAFKDMRSLRDALAAEIATLPDILSEPLLEVLERVRRGILADGVVKQEIEKAKAVANIEDPEARQKEMRLLRQKLRGLVLSDAVGQIADSVAKSVTDAFENLFR